MTLRKLYFLDTTGKLHNWSHSGCDITCTADSKHKLTKSQHGGLDKVPQLAEKLLTFNWCWEKENEFSLVVWPLVSQPHLRAGPALKSSWVPEIGLNGLRE